MTRNGKIARLPKDVREELNRRLQNGHFGSGLLKWLNQLPECEDMLADYFDCQPITKQNLSEWKQGGYKDWLRQEEARQHVQLLAENSEDLENEAGAMSIADRLGTVVSMQLLAMIEQLGSIADPKERWRQLREILRELHHLRREDHRARRLRMSEEQWKVKCEREAEQQEKAKAEKLLRLHGAMENKIMLSKMKGRGDQASKWVDWELRVHYGLPMPPWWNNPQTMEEWSELMMPFWEEQVKERREEAGLQAAKEGKSQGTGNIQHPTTNIQHPMSGGMNSALQDATGQGESDPVKAGQTKSDRSRKGPESGDAVRKDGDKRDACPTSDSVQPGQSESDRPAPESTVQSPQSTVDGNRGKTKSLDNKTEDGDKRDACPTSDSVQPGQSESDQVKPGSGDECRVAGESNGKAEG